MNYQKIYFSLIEKAKKQNRQKNKGIYYESHHIIPICLGGKGSRSQWSWHPNIVLLTAKEHYLCHKLLCEIYPDNNALFLAYWLLSNYKKYKKHIRNSRDYERAKLRYVEYITKNNPSKNHDRRLNISNEAKLRIGELSPTYRTKWMHKNENNKLVKIDQIDEFINNGWKMGIKDSSKKLRSINSTEGNNSSAKSITMYNYKTKEFIKTFTTIKQAIAYINSDKSSTTIRRRILSVCSGKLDHFENYIFKQNTNKQ